MPEDTPAQCWARVQAYVRQTYEGPDCTPAQLAEEARDVYFHVYGQEPPLCLPSPTSKS